MWVLVLAALLAWPALTLATPCHKTRMRCAYRTGCGAALNNYMLFCSDVMAGPVKTCPEQCQHAIIALTSTEEGKELMNCECGDDDYCLESKARIDVCRPQVLQTTQNETVSCRLSQLICAADAQCATALEYYHRLCRSMFHGKKCSHKCLNSINILRKQEKAAMLERCKCDGLEDFDCPRIQTNMAMLCFHKKPQGEGRGGDQAAHGREEDRSRSRVRTPTEGDRKDAAGPVAAADRLVIHLGLLLASSYVLLNSA